MTWNTPQQLPPEGVRVVGYWEEFDALAFVVRTDERWHVPGHPSQRYGLPPTWWCHSPAEEDR